MPFRLPSRRAAAAGLGALSILLGPSAAVLARAPAADPLPAWNSGPVKDRIEGYVARVTTPGPGFVPREERIAVFDNDGTLWVEQPLYFQFIFTIDRIRQLVAANPALRETPALRAIADKGLAAVPELSIQELLDAAGRVQAGLTPEAFQAQAKAWLHTARHPRFGVPYVDLLYEPQLELLAYLRKNGFKTFIVSGGDVQFMRAFAERSYGAPPEQVIGSRQAMRFELQDGRGVVVATPAFRNLDDGQGKPQNIAVQIGRCPLFAVGNSDDDLQMLQYSAGCARPSLQVLVHHDDPVREYAYDRNSKVGRLDKALDAAVAKGWAVVSMRSDWKVIFPPAEKQP